MFDYIYWQDYVAKNLSEFEKNVFDLSTSHGKVKIKNLLFSTDDDFYCFENVYTHQKLQTYAEKSDHLKYFQEMAEKKLHLVNNVFNNSKNTCPPYKAVLILRNQGYGNRRLVGESIIFKVLQKHNISLDRVIISSRNSSITQAKVFNSYGLIISPHSSQLTNLLYAQKKSVLIVPSPFFYEDVFFNLANVLGLETVKSIGHKSSVKRLLKPECLNEKVFNSLNCSKTWRQVLSGDTILDETIIENDLNVAIDKLKKCYIKT